MKLNRELVGAVAVTASMALRMQPRTPRIRIEEPAIQKFEEADKVSLSINGGIVFFVGASSTVLYRSENTPRAA